MTVTPKMLWAAERSVGSSLDPHIVTAMYEAMRSLEPSAECPGCSGLQTAELIEYLDTNVGICIGDGHKTAENYIKGIRDYAQMSRVK